VLNPSVKIWLKMSSNTVRYIFMSIALLVTIFALGLAAFMVWLMCQRRRELRRMERLEAENTERIRREFLEAELRGDPIDISLPANFYGNTDYSSHHPVLQITPVLIHPRHHTHYNRDNHRSTTNNGDLILLVNNNLSSRAVTLSQIDQVYPEYPVYVDSMEVETALVCSVCLEEFESNQKLRKLECEHFFHSECISRWIMKACRCPLCNTKVEFPKNETNLRRERDGN